MRGSECEERGRRVRVREGRRRKEGDRKGGGRRERGRKAER